MIAEDRPEDEQVSFADRDLGPVASWIDEPSFRDSRFWAEMVTRLITGRDANIIITASSETGVGKTTLAVAIALALDQHGWTAEKAAVGSAAEYDYLYDRCEPGSVLLLDEAEKAVDSRRGMSSESVGLSQSFAAKRYRQVFSILTAPSKSWLDKRLGSDAADYWIQCQETDLGRVKGEARVYRLKTNEHYGSDYSKEVGTLTWPPLDGNAAFEALDKKKRNILESGEESGYVSAGDVEKMKEEAAEEALVDQRKTVITQLYEMSDLTQKQIGSLFDISHARVSQILKGV